MRLNRPRGGGCPPAKKTQKNLFACELERLRSRISKKTGETWTQKKIAEKLGVTVQAYQNWARGRRGKKIDLEVLKRLAEVLGGDFIKLVRLARPDIFKCMQTLKLDPGMYHPEVAYLANFLNMLHLNDRKEFNNIKRVIEKVRSGKSGSK